ncbi:MAG: hypothetical protein QME79_13185 [Bacillota bacterium]|nr:hypothetical protein [Bacillota bacterium]
MDLVTLRRRHTAWCIQQNPTMITVQRTEKVAAGGGLSEVKSTKGPFTVRIFQQGGGRPRDVTGLAGAMLVNTGWGLLADHLADLKAGPNVRDEFEVPGIGRFVVRTIYPQVMLGQVVGYQAETEKVI